MTYRRIVISLSIILVNLWITSDLFAGKLKYPVTAIPDSLKASAKAVVRFENTTFKLENIKHATISMEYAVTILNKSGIQQSYFMQPYDKFSKIKNIHGAVYDAEGELVKKFRTEDIQDISANFGGSLFIDNRIKAIDPDYYKYPFTVEYSCDIDYDGLLNYPRWQVYHDYNVSIQKAKFTIKSPDEINIRRHESNIHLEPITTIVNGERILTWEVENLKALKEEPFSGDLSQVSPTIYFAPDNFLIDGYEGNAESWKSFGDWIYKLNEGHKELTEETKQKVLELIKDAESDSEKAKILYKYLQDNTRYVSVQVGIGGWQPIEAAEVDKLSYGDCKALTNYMSALLQIGGIKSYYTLVKAGENTPEIISDFPSNQFNHAILCALVDNDTVWLECTSQRIPYGYLGSFTDDRDVLLINEEGGILVHTPVYDKSINARDLNAVVEIDNLGDALVNASFEFRGVFYDDELKTYLSDDFDQKRFIREDLHLPNFVLEDYSIDESREWPPSIAEKLTLSIDGCGTKFGNRMALNLNLLNKTGKIPSKKEKRRSNIIIQRSSSETDTVLYKIPPGFSIDKISGNRSVKSDFGSYSTYVLHDESTVTYIRHLEINKGIYPADKYNEFYDFYNSVKKGDDDRVIFLKNSSNSVN